MEQINNNGQNKRKEKLQGRALVTFSKALSKLLRHDAEKQGLQIRPDGFISLDDVLNVAYIKKLRPTVDDVFTVVEDNNKKRFEVKKNEQFPDLWLIRAVQGHTIKAVKDEDLLEPITINFKDRYNVFNFGKGIVHGTQLDVLKFIMDTGLCRMARNHVHMAIGLPGEDGVISGMRNSCNAVIEVNMAKAVIGGEIPFFISNNHVVLSPGLGEKGYIPPENFRCVFNPRTEIMSYQAPIEYLVVINIQCNQAKNIKELACNEIIELSIFIINTKSCKIVEKWQTLIKPTMVKKLDPFCTEKTGITNEMIFENKDLPNVYKALQELHKFLLKQTDCFKHEFVLLSAGDFECTQIKREAEFKKFTYPSYLKRWINIKKVWPADQLNQKFLSLEDPKLVHSKNEWTRLRQIKTAKQRVKNHDEMTNSLGIDMIPKDGGLNVANCVIKLLQFGFEFNQAMVMQIN